MPSVTITTIASVSIASAILSWLIVIDAPRIVWIPFAVLVLCGTSLGFAVLYARTADLRAQRYMGIFLISSGIALLASGATGTVFKVTLNDAANKPREELVVEFLKHDSVFVELFLLGGGCFAVHRGCQLLQQLNRLRDLGMSAIPDNDSDVASLRRRLILARNTRELQAVHKEARLLREKQPTPEIAILVDEIANAIASEESRLLGMFPQIRLSLHGGTHRPAQLLPYIIFGLATLAVVSILASMF